jgi:spore maturation protein CgeB
MKVLLVAPQSRDTILGAIGNYCSKALKNLGYQVKIFDFRRSQYFRSPMGSIFKKWIKKVYYYPRWKFSFVESLEKEKMNQRLSELARDYKPDIMFVLMGDTISSRVLQEARQQGVVTANWFHDTVLAPTRKDFVLNTASDYDYFFIIDSEDVLNYIKIGARCVRTIPLACAPDVHKNINLTEKEQKNYRSEVCFVGTLKFNRERVLSHLIDFDLGIWGYWIKKNPMLAKFYKRKHFFAEEAVKIYNSSDIVLDINQGNENQRFYVTPRVFEVPACGAFLLTEENPCLSTLYEVGNEIICYKDEKELRELIRYYLKHPEERKTIAQRGQLRAYHDHTYEKRIQDIFSIIEKSG